MKNLFVLALVSLFSFSAYAQSGLGIKAGINYSMRAQTVNGVDVSDMFDNHLGLNFAVYYDIPVSDKLSISPELNYVQKGYDSTFELFGQAIEYQIDNNYLELPIMVKYFFPVGETSNVYLNAGPSFGYALNGSVTAIDNGTETKEEFDFEEGDGYNRLDLGFAFGAGVGIGIGSGKLVIDARYNLDLNDNNKSDDVEIKTNNLGVMVGYLFSIGN